MGGSLRVKVVKGRLLLIEWGVVGGGGGDPLPHW